MDALLQEINQTKANFVCKHTGEELLLIPLKDNVADFNKYLVLNEVGAFIWNGLHTEISYATLQNQILNEFEVNKENLNKDLQKFILELHQYTCKNEANW
jgi:hypothetical protein